MQLCRSCCIAERPGNYREVMTAKSKPVLQKKRIEAPPKSPEKKPLKQNTAEREIKEIKQEQKAPKLNIEDEVRGEEEEHVEGQFELNALMTRVLEEELQTLMIKVWQALPDEPPTEAERFVAERLRNEASDDLRNVLGLNVTKRLLNVYNPLFVKLRFSCRPESGCLTKFLDAYNVQGFKRINKETNTFAARLRSISDFDNICATKIIRCGGAKITVTPCYKFSLCPKKLNTIFADKGEDIGKIEKDDKGINENEDNKEVTSKEKETKVSEPNKKEENSTTALRDKDTLQKVDVIESKDASTTFKNEVTEKITIKEKKKLKEEGVIKSTISEKKINIEPKETKKVKSPLVKSAQIATVKENSQSKPLTTPNKVSETIKNVIKNEVEIDESEVDNEFDDGDEMNDEEILALISSGVIVDEYIGSDEE